MSLIVGSGPDWSSTRLELESAAVRGYALSKKIMHGRSVNSEPFIGSDFDDNFSNFPSPPRRLSMRCEGAQWAGNAEKVLPQDMPGICQVMRSTQ